MISEYFKNHVNPRYEADGYAPDSYPSRGAMSCRTKGLMKPANTVAEACIPSVSLKASTVIPRMNESNRISHLGVPNGKSMMNRTYMYGLINRLTCILFSNKTCRATSKMKLLNILT